MRTVDSMAFVLNLRGTVFVVVPSCMCSRYDHRFPCSSFLRTWKHPHVRVHPHLLPSYFFSRARFSPGRVVLSLCFEMERKTRMVGWVSLDSMQIMRTDEDAIEPNPASSMAPHQAKQTRALFDALYERLVLGRSGNEEHALSNHETHEKEVKEPGNRRRRSTRPSTSNSHDVVQPYARATCKATDERTAEGHVDVSPHEKQTKELKEWKTVVDVERSFNPVPRPRPRHVDPSDVRSSRKKEERSRRRKRGTNPKTSGRLDCCSICYQPFRRGVPWTKLPSCGHRFHVPCIQTWVEVQNTCPTCRVRITKVQKQHVPDRSLATLLPNAAYEALVCTACGSGADEGRLLLCDGCDRGWHIYCLVPPKPQLPSEEEAWFCDTCTSLHANAIPGDTGASQHPPSIAQAPLEALEAPPTQPPSERPPQSPGVRKRTRGGGQSTGSRTSIREGASHPPA